MFVLMKKSGTSSKIQTQAVVDDDGVYKGDISLITQRVDIGDFYKLMLGNNEKLISYFGANFGVFYYLMEHVVWSTGHVSTSNPVKEYIADKCGIKKDMIESHFRNYIKMDLMKRIAPGTCIINPLKIFMGDKSQQKQVAFTYFREEWTKK